MPAVTSLAWARAVMRMIGRSASFSSARMARQTSRPLMPGMVMSSSSSRGEDARQAASASSPLPTAVTLSSSSFEDELDEVADVDVVFGQNDRHGTHPQAVGATSPHATGPPPRGAGPMITGIWREISRIRRTASPEHDRSARVLGEDGGQVRGASSVGQGHLQSICEPRRAPPRVDAAGPAAPRPCPRAGGSAARPRARCRPR